MSAKKRCRGGSVEEQDATNLKDHLACDQCRVKKIRCGKERPKCSNCTRLGLHCEWSGSGKKPSQTLLLNQSLSTLGRRLEHIESNIAGIQQFLQQNIPTYPYFTSLDSNPEPESGLGHVGESKCAFKDAAGLGHHVVHGPHGYERYFGPPSLMSLMHGFDNFSLALLNQQELLGAAASPNPVAVACEKVKQLAAMQLNFKNMSDKPAIKEPSMLILVAFLDPYFDLCNPHLPIFTRSGFRRFLDEGEKADATHTKSFAICANNLVLLTLIAKALHGRVMSSQVSNETIDDELIQSFVDNADRAIGQVEQLLQPRLINVQALLSLCAVAQICLSEEVFSLALTLAGQVAKSMGLHQPQEGGSKLSLEDVEERRNVFYCLYCLDKAVCWNQGWPPSMSASAVSTWMSTPPMDHFGLYMRAKFALCQIEDDLYTCLYIVGAATQSSDQPFNVYLQRFQARLSNWRRLHELDQEESGEHCRLAECSRLDLEISYHLARMQLLSPFTLAGGIGVCNVLLEDSRKCLGFLQRLGNMTSDQGHYSSFVRLISSFPPTVVCQLAANCLETNRAQNDLGLLNFLAKSLQVISLMFGTKDSYLVKFSAFVDILLSLANNNHLKEHSDSQRYSLIEPSHPSHSDCRRSEYQSPPRSHSEQGTELQTTEAETVGEYYEAREDDANGHLDLLMTYWNSELSPFVDLLSDEGMGMGQRRA